MKKLFTILFLFALAPFVWSQQLHIVETVGNTGFNPTNLTVALGDTVRWVNTGGGHNVNATQAAYPNNPDFFGNAVGVNWTFDHVFTVPGFYNYQCDPHLGLGMVGTVTVLNGPAYPIGLVTGDGDGNGEADSVGVACTLTGVVYGIDMQGGGNIQFTIIDGNNDGIGLFSTNDFGYTVTEGDEVTIDGTISSFNGLAQINPDTVIVNSSGNALIAATTVTALDESTESQLVTLENVTLVDPTQWDNAGSNNIDVTDGTNTWTVRIDSDVADLNAAPAPTGAFNITGLGGQFDSSDPYLDGYQLLPRYLADLENIVAPGMLDIGTITADSDMNGEADSVGVSGTITGIVYGIDMQGGTNVQFTVIDANNNGIGIFSSAFTSYVVAEGDQVTISGTVSSFNGLAQFAPDAEIVVNSSGNALLAPTVVTALDESTESQLVTLQNVTLVDPTQWDNAGSNNIDVTDGTNTYLVRIDSDVVDLNAAPAPAGAFNITGIGGQFDSSDPYLDGYQLLPRYLADLEIIVGPTINANDDAVNLPIDATSSIDVLANDELPNPITTLMIINAATGGMATANGTTDITYTSTMGFCGNDSFTYEICDGTNCDTATVNITIDCPPSYPLYTIGAVTGDSDGDFVPDSLGVTCEVTGVVHNPDFRGGAGYTFTIIGADGNGIAVFDFDDVSGYTDPVEGDELTLQGEIGQFNGLIQFRPVSITTNSSGNALVTPTDVTTLGEETESQLVRMENMSLVDPTQWLGGGSSFNVDITDGTNTFAMRIENESELSTQTAITGIFNVTGIGGQFDTEDPRDGDYQIFPRYLTDIEEVISTVNPDLAEKIKLQPNPVSELLQVKSEIQLDHIIISNMLGQQVTELRQPNLNETINVNNWQSGVYVITFVTGDEIWTSQFVKQ